MAYEWTQWRLIGCLVGSLTLGACGGDPSVAPGPAAVVTPPAAAPRVHVSVLGLAALPLADVRAEVVGGSAATSTSDDGRGSFELPAPATVLLKFSKEGYTDSFKPVAFAPGSSAALIQVSLRPRDTAQPLDATAGGTLSGRDGATVVLPANGLVDATTGAVVAGMVDVAMTPIDVGGDELRAFPGRFMGVDSAGAMQMIASYGTTEFVLTQAGRRLNLAPGQLATIELPIYTPYHSPGVPVVAGDVIALWSLDESSGVWKQEGTGTVVESAASGTGLAMRATVGHFSWWNCDFAATQLKLDLDITLPDVEDKDRVDDPRPKDDIDILTDPNRYHVGALNPVHIDGRTADDRLLRQAGIDFEAVFKDGGLSSDRKQAQGARYGVATGLRVPADRAVALTACAQVQRADATRFAPVMACGTALLSATAATAAKVTIQLQVGGVSDVPYVVVQPKTAAVDSGAAATFSVTAIRGFSNDSVGLGYQWTKNGVPIAAATSASYVTPASTRTDDGSLYAVIVTSPAGVTLSRYARLTLNAPPPPPPPPPNAATDRWVDAVLGNDANAGTVGAPYRTITAAIAVVPRGGTIWLNDGTWTAALDAGLGSSSFGLNCSTDGSFSPSVAGTILRAINPGRATIRYASMSAICVGDTQLRGLRLEDATANNTSTAISAAVPGSSLLSGVSFQGGLIVVRNGGRLTLEPAGLASYGSLGIFSGRAISVSDAGSEVVVNGGAFDALSPVSFNGSAPAANCVQGASLYANRGARLVLNRVDLRPGPARSAATKYANAIAGCNASIELNGSSISGFTEGTTPDSGAAVVITGGTLTTTGASVLSANKTGVFGRDASVVLGAGMQVVGSTGNGVVVKSSSSSGSMALTMEPGSAVLGSGGHGVYADGTGTGQIALEIASASLSGNSLAGLRLLKVTRCRVRDTRFADNVQFGVYLDAFGSCDLGTVESRGGNTFANVGPNLSFQPSSTEPAATVMAVGNTWAASQQGADGQGRYAVPAGQTVLEVSGPVTTGANYRLSSTKTTLRLAQ